MAPLIKKERGRFFLPNVEEKKMIEMILKIIFWWFIAVLCAAAIIGPIFARREEKDGKE